MALLFNPESGDDPDVEDGGWDVHAPSCRCDICEEERAISGADDYDPDDEGDEGRESDE